MKEATTHPPNHRFLSRLIIKIINILSWIYRTLFYRTNRIVVERINLKSNNQSIPKSKELKFIQISDIHWDFSTELVRITDTMMKKTIEIVNNEEADFVFITGDFVQKYSGPIAELCGNYLSKLKAKQGIWAVLGNHDYKDGEKGTELIKSSIINCGINLLDNENVKPFPWLEIVGLGDYKMLDFNPEKAFSNLDDSSAYRIVLSHNPDSADVLRERRIDIQLSGHTHGGQVVIPFLGPAIPLYYKTIQKFIPKWLHRYIPGKKFFFVVEKWKWCEGLHIVEHINDVHDPNILYVNRGLATHPPLRFWCPPEITVFSLTSNK